MRGPAKVAVALALVAAGAGIALAGASPDAHRTVTDVHEDPALGPGADVEVKATVVEGSVNRSADPTTFLLGDDRNELLVRYHEPIPVEQVGGTLDGRTAVVGGVLAEDPAGTLLLEGDRLEVGCASKYEAS